MLNTNPKMRGIVMSKLSNENQLKIIELEKFKIAIDEKETKKYFDKLEMKQNQQYKNFEKYIDEKMTDEERNIFDLLCINLKRLNIGSAWYSKNEKWNTRIVTSIIGELISYPKSTYVTIDDVQENGIEILDNIENNSITVGHFNIHILIPDERELSLNDCENRINIEIYVNGLPWLLKEKCNHKIKTSSKLQYYLFMHYPKLVKILVKISIKRFITNYKDKKQLVKVLTEELENLKSRFGVDSAIIQNKEILKYKKQWVNAFLPQNADEDIKKQAYELCVKNKEFNTYLWHIFSFEIINSEDNPVEQFDAVKKNNCTLVFETNAGEFAVKLSNAEKMNENNIKAFCEKVTGWCDFVITADDFSWTYSRTHEDGWLGPYFYKKS